MKNSLCVMALALLPTAVSAQQDPLDRLASVLPDEVAEQVLDRVEAALERQLPAMAAANLALEGVAKGRSAGEVLAAVETLLADMGRAQAALRNAGRDPSAGDIEAATAAMRMGVDGGAVSELARSQRQGRSLAVPLLVMGGLAERGLPSDQALAAVRERLAARGDDAALLADFPEVGMGLARGMGPEQAGPALAGGLAGFQVPVSGVHVPVGPQNENARPPAGRGRGRGGGPGTY